ncbi:4Fe-4S binding domain-containing protein [Oscillibacter sp. PC13]|uniref:4Fe-4S binding protein n=1 Tax=Oscillibacter sp. PC13 TaxID=1855299 RepID=UPI0008ED13E3|nr:4Fe-4S binding protein [Oscillibacter sp. PC13]SFP35098.1 4Fe-4S binding domain-containing protein [Oscillibacter sp. PC13]
MVSKRYAEPDQQVCVACGACEKICPKGAVSVWRGCWSVVDLELCVGCGKCAKICPAGCIRMKERVLA